MGAYSDKIPDYILENPTTKHFIEVLDLLQSYKEEELFKVALKYNELLNFDKSFWKRIFAEKNLSISQNFPIIVLQTTALNILPIIRSFGSIGGVELFCSAFSLGEVSVSPTYGTRPYNRIILDSLVNNEITCRSEDAPKRFFNYIVGNNDFKSFSHNIVINIKTIYYNNIYIKGFIEETLKYILPEGTNVEVTWEQRDKYYFHERLNELFINGED